MQPANVKGFFLDFRGLYNIFNNLMFIHVSFLKTLLFLVYFIDYVITVIPISPFPPAPPSTPPSL